MWPPILLAFPAMALSPHELCLAGPLPGSSQAASKVDPRDPPHILAPNGFTEATVLEPRGLLVDERGRVFDWGEANGYVESRIGLSKPGGADEFYTGGWTTTSTPGYMAGNVFVPGTTITLPDDPAAWRHAKEEAEEARERWREEWASLSAAEQWSKSLCRFNTIGVKELAVKAEQLVTEEQIERVQASMATRVPQAALAATRGVYERLSRPVPADEAQQAADAQAVWAAVQRLGGLDPVVTLVVERAAARPEASVAELLAP